MKLQLRLNLLKFVTFCILKINKRILLSKFKKISFKLLQEYKTVTSNLCSTLNT